MEVLRIPGLLEHNLNNNPILYPHSSKLLKIIEVEADELQRKKSLLNWFSAFIYNYRWAFGRLNEDFDAYVEHVQDEIRSGKIYTDYQETIKVLESVAYLEYISLLELRADLDLQDCAPNPTIQGTS